MSSYCISCFVHYYYLRFLVSCSHALRHSGRHCTLCNRPPCSLAPSALDSFCIIYILTVWVFISSAYLVQFVCLVYVDVVSLNNKNTRLLLVKLQQDIIMVNKCHTSQVVLVKMKALNCKTSA